MRYVKLMPNIPWNTANRNKREVLVALDLGYQVTIVCLDAAPAKDNAFSKCTFVSSGFRPKASLSKFKRYQVLLADTWRLFWRIRHMEKDVISCHDISALTLAYFSTWFTSKKKRPKLIYDSHEFEVERNKRRSKLAKRRVAWWEKFLMRRCVFSIMVNDSIADEVQRIHHLPNRPLVVRSTPELWHIDPAAIQQKRQAFYGDLPDLRDPFLVMYHGAVVESRGIENMLRAVAQLPDTAAVVLGYGDSGYLSSLHSLVEELGIQNRVLFHDAVPIEVLGEYVGAAHVDLAVIPAICKSYLYMLPNKFFESIQSLTPVIVSDYPEIGRLTREYQIGLTVDPMDVSQITQAISQLKEDTALYQRLKENLKVAKEELCWEKERQVLFEALKSLKRDCE